MNAVIYGLLDEATVIHGLYHATRAFGYGVPKDRPDLSVEDVRADIAVYVKPLQRKFHIDYLFGRPLKVDIDRAERTVSTDGYDRNAGVGACKRVVDMLLAGAQDHP